MCVNPQVKGRVTNSGNSIDVAGLNLWTCPGLFKSFKYLKTHVLKCEDLRDYMRSVGVQCCLLGPDAGYPTNVNINQLKLFSFKFIKVDQDIQNYNIARCSVWV